MVMAPPVAAPTADINDHDIARRDVALFTSSSEFNMNGSMLFLLGEYSASRLLKRKNSKFKPTASLLLEDCLVIGQQHVLR